MRKWRKFYLDYEPLETDKDNDAQLDKDKAQNLTGIGEDRDASFADHARAMGGYGGGSGYGSREEFFNKYYYSFHLGRIENYEGFIRECISRQDKVFSLAAGRGALELYLGQDGFDITISDLEPVQSEQTKVLFPFYKFMPLDILKAQVPAGYDVVLCLSLIYLFDERDFEVFINNVAHNLEPGARFILDSAGSAPSIFSNLLHDHYLYWELALIKQLKRDRAGHIRIKEFGYRRSDEEIINAVQDAGFRLVRKNHGGELMELRRSSIFNKIVKEGSKLEALFRPLGKTMPYMRLFEFIKI